MKKKEYYQVLNELQIELIKFQRSVIKQDEKVCIIFEGRDTAGKDGTIKRFTEHLSPRNMRAVALDKPSDREKRALYMQRYIAQLPVGGEIIFFNRSWYNRAGVEKVMGFCTEKEHENFLNGIGNFEEMITEAGVKLYKYYLDISKDEQERRLEARRKDPLKQWKLSPMDAEAQALWNDYSEARDEMFNRSSFDFAPWRIVQANDKKTARINIIKHFLSHMDYDGKKEKLLKYDSNIVCDYG
ncbi:MAG: polyphosphate kinase 2 [Bacteroidetes bacterium]|nr:MAG: polyphosphate kinase 2 [Bacteroidota bacterium]